MIMNVKTDNMLNNMTNQSTTINMYKLFIPLTMILTVLLKIRNMIKSNKTKKCRPAARETQDLIKTWCLPDKGPARQKNYKSRVKNR